MGVCGSLGGEYNKDEVAKNMTEELYNATVESLPALDGKVVAITGCTTGLGFYTALAAAKKNASMIYMLNRQSERAAAAEEKVRAAVPPGNTTKVKTIPCDLQDFASVRACVAALGKDTEETGLDVLCNNAGVMAMPDKRTVDGFEVQMQICQLSHAIFTRELFPNLEKAAAKRGEARIVFATSGARDSPHKQLEEQYFVACEAGTLGGDSRSTVLDMAGFGGPWSRYHQAKLANVAYAMALHDRLAARTSKVKAMCMEPGLAATELQVTSTRNGLMPHWLAKFLNQQGQSAADGAAGMVMCCFHPEVRSGDMYVPSVKSSGAFMRGPPMLRISGGKPVEVGTEKLATNADNKANVFAWCETAVGAGGAEFLSSS
eukprot:TRINITY_DN4981_c0_g2_i1.p1 TRINITY_DN4981_c0_g2~~TRINITY_DN4981_c0_g2_i1.p1  ORF type:complete len:375 (+),score=88.81 TRINITY_DN4981_c0_g2_i1:86-1210(+)